MKQKKNRRLMMTTNEMVGCIGTYMIILIIAWTVNERRDREQEKHQCDDDYMDHTKDV